VGGLIVDFADGAVDDTGIASRGELHHDVIDLDGDFEVAAVALELVAEAAGAHEGCAEPREGVGELAGLVSAEGIAKILPAGLARDPREVAIATLELIGSRLSLLKTSLGMLVKSPDDDLARERRRGCASRSDFAR
jgi:predicted hotdog family 3-hydroxylacyl-ACP dehydratase